MSTEEQEDKAETPVKEAESPRSGRSPMDKVAKERGPLPIPLIVAAAALVVALIAVGVAGWSLYSLKQAEKAPVSDSTEQTSAKLAVCDATIVVRKGISANNTLPIPGGDGDQMGALLKAANARVALVNGSTYLMSKLGPAVPADLSDTVHKFADTLLEIGAAAATGLPNDDPEQANRLHDADTYSAQINDMCSK
ncbi:MAG: hypothetical protein WCE30_26580 [Mycobacterium sp.]